MKDRKEHRITERSLVEAVAPLFGLSSGRMKLLPNEMEKAVREAGLGNIQLLSFVHVEFEVSISHLNIDVILAVEYINLETSLALQTGKKKKKKERSHQEVNANREEKTSKSKP